MPNFRRLYTEAGRIARFGVVGICATLVYAGTTFLFVELFLVSAVAASIIGQVASTGVSYLGHATFSFRVQARHRSYLMRFLLIALLTFGLNAEVTWLLTEKLNVSYRISVAAISVLIPAINYLCNRLWVFNRGLKALSKAEQI